MREFEIVENEYQTDEMRDLVCDYKYLGYSLYCQLIDFLVESQLFLEVMIKNYDSSRI